MTSQPPPSVLMSQWASRLETLNGLELQKLASSYWPVGATVWNILTYTYIYGKIKELLSTGSVIIVLIM